MVCTTISVYYSANADTGPITHAHTALLIHADTLYKKSPHTHNRTHHPVTHPIIYPTQVLKSPTYLSLH